MVNAPNSLMEKVIIFDFDGTLADTLDAIVNITNHLAEEFGYEPTAPEELAQIRNLSSREIIRQSGISIFKIPFLLRRVRNGLRNDIQQINPIWGIKETLIQLKNDGNQLGILTSNSEGNVKTFLEKHGIEDLFIFIHSGATLFGKHKIIRKLMQEKKLISEQVIYVGDETRDIEASRKINIKVIAVSWGFNSKEALAKANPDFLIDRPSELLEDMGSLQKVS